MIEKGLTTIPAVAAAAARRFGNREAVVDGERRIGFAALWEEARRAARAFTSAIGPGDRVGIWAPNCLEWIVACIGIQAAGGVVVTLNTRLKGAEASYILRRSGARMLVTVRGFLGVDYPAMLQGEELPALERVVCFEEGWEEFLGDAPPGRALPYVSPSDPSDILFTSGTTGDPKGVVSSHGQSVLCYRIWAETVGLHEEDRYLAVNPFFHAFGYKAGWLACLVAGATVYPMPTLEVVALAELISRHRITVLPGPPAIFQTLLATDLARAGLSSLRLSVTGAASVPPVLIERMRGELGIDHVLIGYGLTEACGLVSLTAADDPADVAAATCGRPIPGIEVRIAGKDGVSLAPGEEGEVLVSGFNVMQGYFGDLDATAAAIDSEGWLHTGDVGQLDEAGRLAITDRIKDMYISGGFNCYPAEIERHLQCHPDIALAAVIGVPDDRMGEVGKAFILPVAGCSPDGKQIIAWARESMANYKVPRFIEIVGRLPLNAAGKVQKSALRASQSA